MAKQAVQHMDGMCLSSRSASAGTRQAKRQELQDSHMDAHPPHLSSIIVFSPQKVHQACKESLTSCSNADVRDTLPWQIDGFAEFLSSRPTHHLTGLGRAWRIFAPRRPIGSQYRRRMIPHILVDRLQRLVGPHAISVGASEGSS